jgi:hypothetical protein
VYAFKDDLETLGLRIEAGEHRDRGGHDLRGTVKRKRPSPDNRRPALPAPEPHPCRRPTSTT